MPSTPNRSLFSMLVAALAVMIVRPASAAVILYRNGFESADTCAWRATEPAVTCDPDRVFVPAGNFSMGSSTSDYPDEKPMHTVYLSAYWINRTAVTVNAYAACVAAGGCTVPNGSYPGGFLQCNWGAPGRGNHPINCVDWSKSKAYCAWAGMRLPTEAEWEKAARGTDARTYPWGEETPTCEYAVFNDVYPDEPVGCGTGTMWPVGSKPAGASPYGALDMAGNVTQWVSDWYKENYYANSPPVDPVGPKSGTFKVTRGGAYYEGFAFEYFLHSAARGGVMPDVWQSGIGVRCAVGG